MVSSEKKQRKQRSPFYVSIGRDKAKEKQGRKKFWYLITITRSETGQSRSREYFVTRREAKEAQDKALDLQRNEGLAAVGISAQLRVEAIQAAKILAGRATLVQVAEYFLSHASPSKEITVQELFEKYRTFQKDDGASDAYQADINWRLKRFAEHFPKSKKAHEVTVDDINKYLSTSFIRRGKVGQKKIKKQTPRKLSPAGRKNELRNIRPMIHFALDNGHIQVSPFPLRHFRERKSKRKDRQNIKEVSVLTIEQADAVIRKAGVLTPYIAVGLFAGVRPDETKALDWSDFNWESKSIKVNARLSTSHDQRPVEMSDNLIEWLLPFKAEKGSIVPPRGFRERFAKMATASGLSPWPKDVLRHSFASYWLAKHQKVETLRFLMGHHLSSDMLKKHYLKVVTSTEAEKYWTIRP